MSDRLTDLRRQRAAIQQHLDWLDREIAAEQTGPGAPPAPAPAAPVPVIHPTAPRASEADPGLTDLGQPDPVNAARQAKKGCLLYLVVALVIFFTAIFAIFYFAYGDRPWLFMDRSEAAQGANP